MDNVLLRRSQPISAKKNPYNRFDLVENPFPRSPTVTPGSHDPRVNGEIYCKSLRGEEQKQFERLLVPHPERSSTRPMASLMDLATRRGRGIGKTAFLNHQRRQIMTDMGNQYTNGAYVLLAAHLIPEGGGRTRKSWQFIRLIAQSLNTNRCIASAIWRLRAFSGVIPDEIMDKINSDDLEGTIGNNRWLENEGINVAFDLNASVKRKLRDHGVSEEIAHALATYGTSHETWEQGFLSQQSDYQWRQMGSTWVFDEFVRLFQAAEINQVLLLVDEVEKIVSPQNRQERRAFAEDIRLFFIDGPFQSVLASPHFGVLWTISPYLQELWQV